MFLPWQMLITMDYSLFFPLHHPKYHPRLFPERFGDNYHLAEWNKAAELLYRTEWDAVLPLDVDEHWNAWKNHLVQIMELCIPHTFTKPRRIYAGSIPPNRLPEMAFHQECSRLLLSALLIQYTNNYYLISPYLLAFSRQSGSWQRITPIPKGTNKSLLSGYRPISDLRTVSKLIERHMKAVVEIGELSFR